MDKATDQDTTAILVLDKPLVKTRTEVHVLTGITLLEALDSVGIQPRQAMIAVVNGVVQDVNYRLQPGDVARLLMQISGG
jgi:sulfur carrier protein ThiS